MEIVLVIVVSVSVGFLLGAFFKSSMFENQDWRVMRWDSHIMAYRPVSIGTELYAGDNVIMSLSVDTDSFPVDGVVVE